MMPEIREHWPTLPEFIVGFLCVGGIPLFLLLVAS